MPYQDKTITCVDCGTEFIFTAGEQEFYASKGFTNEPRRCPPCRSARRAATGVGGAGAVSATSTSSGGRELYVTRCASCGGEARVPFQPRTAKPVYCSNCFRTQGGSRAGVGAPGGERGGRWQR